jgi:hypothetical protein
MSLLLAIIVGIKCAAMILLAVGIHGLTGMHLLTSAFFAAFITDIGFMGLFGSGEPVGSNQD